MLLARAYSGHTDAVGASTAVTLSVGRRTESRSMLSRIAQQHAAEIRNHDWSDAPWRADRAGHQRRFDTNRQVQQLEPREAETVKLNVMWVTAQVLGYNDPAFDVVEFADACGCAESRPGVLRAGLRGAKGAEYSRPGSYETDSEYEERLRSTG